MTEDFSGFTRADLIKRALQEEHAAVTAEAPEARTAHFRLAQILRDRADEAVTKTGNPFPVGKGGGPA